MLGSLFSLLGLPAQETTSTSFDDEQDNSFIPKTDTEDCELHLYLGIHVLFGQAEVPTPRVFSFQFQYVYF